MLNNILKKILNLSDEFGFKGEVRITSFKDGKIVRQTPWMRNKVVSSSDNGRNLILKALAGTALYDLEITHAEMGLGTTPATDGDTETEDPQARNQVGNVTVSTNIMNLKFYFSDVLLPDGSYTELTMWMDGTATIGTGRIFNRIVFSPYVKASGEDITVEVRVTATG